MRGWVGDGADMLKRLLIANRGEIAVRIIRACRELGIETVAVYSDADARAPHVLAADRAVRIGPAAPRESYLNTEAIFDAARASGADAVHPGYGFLSERAFFARACEEQGIIFVGPPSTAIERMGSKVGARRLMQAAGVPVVPGETPARRIGRRPGGGSGSASATRSLIKPSAGGGGIGMKIVREPSAMAEAVAAARREAQASFGDGTRLRRAPGRSAAAHRDPGVCRRARPRRPPLRARVLDAAPAPEDRRGESVAGAVAGGPRPHGRRRGRRGAGGGIPQRRHGGVPARRLPATMRGSISWR